MKKYKIILNLLTGKYVVVALGDLTKELATADTIEEISEKYYKILDNQIA